LILNSDSKNADLGRKVIVEISYPFDSEDLASNQRACNWMVGIPPAAPQVQRTYMGSPSAHTGRGGGWSGSSVRFHEAPPSGNVVPARAQCLLFGR
jgi:hypothetical protein